MLEPASLAVSFIVGLFDEYGKSLRDSAIAGIVGNRADAWLGYSSRFMRQRLTGTTLPANHDLLRAVRDSLREAGCYFLVRLAREVAPELPLWECLKRRLDRGALLLSDANLERVALERFEQVLLDDQLLDGLGAIVSAQTEQLLRSTREADAIQGATPFNYLFWLWAREQLKDCQVPPLFDEWLKQGFLPEPDATQIITIHTVFSLFFHEKLKRSEAVARIFNAQALSLLESRGGGDSGTVVNIVRASEKAGAPLAIELRATRQSLEALGGALGDARGTLGLLLGMAREQGTRFGELEGTLRSLHSDVARIRAVEAQTALIPELVARLDVDRASMRQIQAQLTEQTEQREALFVQSTRKQHQLHEELSKSLDASVARLLNAERPSVAFKAQLTAESPFVPPDIKPNFPDDWVLRPELPTIAGLLLGSSRRIVLRGPGGFGKTSLAIAVCHDAEICKAFKDGILWISLGRNPDVARLVQQQFERLAGAPRPNVDLDQGSSRLRELLRDRCILLVLDDLWDERDAEPFLVPSRGAVLITTRVGRVSTALDAVEHEVGRLPDDAAVTLLRTRLRRSLADDGEALALRDLSDVLGGWPLLIRLASGFLAQQVKRGRSLSESIAHTRARLTQHGPGAFHEDYRKSPQPIEACIMLCFDDPTLASLERSNELKARFVELGVFADHAEVPLHTVARLWSETAGLSAVDSEDTLLQLEDWALFDHFELRGSRGHFRLHDSIRSFLRVKLGEQLPALHRALLASYQVSHYAELEYDGYILEHLCEHLCAAEGTTAARELLVEFRWLAMRLRAGGMTAMLHDFHVLDVARRSATEAEQDSLVKANDHLLQCIRLCANTLAQRPAELASQLLARLSLNNQHVDKLRRDAATAQTSPSIRLRTPSLRRPEGGLVCTMVGHHGRPHAALLPDGRRLLSGGDDTLRTWDTATGLCLRSLRVPHEVVHFVLLPCGARVLAWDHSGKLSIADIESGVITHTLRGHTDGVVSCELIRDGTQALTEGTDGTARLWDLASGECVTTLEVGRAPIGFDMIPIADGAGVITQVRGSSTPPKIWYLPAGESKWAKYATMQQVEADLAIGVDKDGAMHLVSFKSPALTRPLGASHPGFRCALFAEASSQLFTWSKAGTLKLWDLEAPERSKMVEGYQGTVHEACLAPDGKRVLAWTLDGAIYVCDRESGVQLATLRGHRNSVNGVRFLRGGDHAVSWGSDGTIRTWDLATSSCLQVFNAHAWGVSGIALLAGDEHLVSWGSDVTLKIWALEQLSPASVASELRSPWGIALGPRTQQGVLSWDEVARLWEPGTATCVGTFSGHTKRIRGACLLEPQDRIATWSEDGTIRIWSIKEQTCLHILRGHEDSVGGAVRVCDTSLLLSWSTDCTLRLWDTQTGQCLRTFTGHEKQVIGAQVLDANRALSRSSDQTLVLWDLRSGASLAVLRGPTDSASGMRLLGGGSHALSWGRDASIWVWDLETGRCVDRLAEHRKWILGTALLEQGRRLLSWSRDFTLRVWDLELAECLMVMRGHRGHVIGAMLLEGDSRVLSWSKDGTLKMWDLASGRCLRTFGDRGADVRGVSLVGNGQQAVSWHSDCRICLWNLIDGSLIATLTLDAPPRAVAITSPAQAIASDEEGGLHFLQLGVPAADRPPVTLEAQGPMARESAFAIPRIVEPIVLPVVALRGGPVFPAVGVLLSITGGRPRSIAALSAAAAGIEALVVLAVQRDPTVENPGLAELLSVGVVARVLELSRSNGGAVTASLAPLLRVQILSSEASELFIAARVGPIAAMAADDENRSLAAALIQAQSDAPRSYRPDGLNKPEWLARIEDLDRLADHVAGTCFRETPLATFAPILESTDTKARLRELLRLFPGALGRTARHRVYYLRHRPEGSPGAYFFVRIDRDKLAEFERVSSGTTRFKLDDFGDILASGHGDPSPKLKAHMKEKYGVRYSGED